MRQLTTSNNKWFLVLKYIGFFALFFIANKAGINQKIYPFVFGIYFALIWCNQNVVITSICYLLAGYLADFNIIALVCNLFFCFIFLIFYGVHAKIKKPLKYLHLLIYACISNIPKVAIEICFNNSNIYLIFVELLFGLLFTFSCIKLFESSFVKGICSNYTVLEIICAITFIGAISCGFSSINIYNFSIIKLIGIFIVLIFSYVGNLSTTLLISTSIGLGTAFYNNNFSLFCAFVLYGLTISMFKTKNKYTVVAGVITCECLCGNYFSLYSAFDLITILPVFFSCFVYLLIPNSFLDKFSNEFQFGVCGLTQQSVINKNREHIYYRLMELSDVFNEMNKVFRGLVGGAILNSDAKRMLLNELRIKTCKDCLNQGKCYRICNDETNKALNTMVDRVFEKGRINLLDVPTLFAGKCERLNSLVGTTNDLINQYKNYAGLVNNIDASKVLLADQLLGVSNIMNDLALELNSGVNFERGKEKKILDELTYNNIICSDVLVFQEGEDILSVTLAVREEDVFNPIMAKTVSKICGQTMDVYDTSKTARAGWHILTLKSSPIYEVIFGIATRTKTGSTKSGDSYSVVKLKDGKYIFAICDGMGSGEKAEATSSTALGLLENFFKAGFDKEIILSSVNKLLSLGRDDVFSALDLCVVDTRTGMGDFIKMGAPESFIKHRETTDIVSIGALPLGIIQNTEAKSQNVYLSAGDKIIMMSDGISDSFKNSSEIQNYINNLSINTPQNMADEIIRKVLKDNSNIAKDDMTVMVIKIFEK